MDVLCVFDDGCGDVGGAVFFYYEDVAGWGGPLEGEEVGGFAFCCTMSILINNAFVCS